MILNEKALSGFVLLILMILLGVERLADNEGRNVPSV